MNQQHKKILRKTQKLFHNIQKEIQFKTSHLSNGGKIALLGCIICTVSLFYPWAFSLDAIISSGNIRITSLNSFSSILGYIGYIILFTLGLIFFSIFSIKKKEKIHFASLIYLSDYLTSLLGALLISILSFQSFLFINGLKIFSKDINYGSGIILCITGSIVIFIGAVIMKKEYRKNIKGSYISELHSDEIKETNGTKKNNMKLPF